TDTGANALQNFPVLTQVSLGTTTRVVGTFSGTADATITLDFYATTVVHLSGHGDAQGYLGSATIATDSDGFAAFDLILPGVAPGEYVTATATDLAGNTSEFAAAVRANRPPLARNDSGAPYTTNEDTPL